MRVLGIRGAARRRRLVGLGGVVAVSGMALAACSSSPSSTTTTTKPSSTTSSTTTTPTTTASTVSTAPAAPSSTTAAGLSVCAGSALTGSVAGSSGAAGTIETTVALRGTGSTSCILDGFPGLQLLAAGGTSLPTTVVRTGSYSFTAMAPASITLAPGQTAYFNIGYSDVPVGSETTCPTSASVEVTPPNAVDHLVVAAAFAPCGGGKLVVSPVFLSVGSASQTTAPPPA